MKSGSGDLAAGPQAGDGRPAARRHRHPAHVVVSRRPDRDRLPGRIEPGGVTDRGDGREAPRETAAERDPGIEKHFLPRGDLPPDGAGDHVPGCQLGAGHVGHEALAAAVDQDGAFAPDRLRGQRHRIGAQRQRGRMELDELQVAQDRPGPRGERQAAADRAQRVGRRRIESANSAGRQHDGPRSQEPRSTVLDTVQANHTVLTEREVGGTKALDHGDRRLACAPRPPVNRGSADPTRRRRRGPPGLARARLPGPAPCRHPDRDRNGRPTIDLTGQVREGIACHSSRAPLPRTLEGRIVRVIDRVAYINHDIDDAVRAGLLHEQELPSDPIAVLGQSGSERIDALVHDMVEHSGESGDIVQGPTAGPAMAELRKFMFERVYLGPAVRAEHARIANVVRRLFEHYVEHPELLPASQRADSREGEPSEQGRPEGQELAQRVTDYLAGMTDRYCIREYTDLEVPRAFAR